MNIVFLTHEFVKDGCVVGGLGNYLYNIASALTKKGHKIFVVVDMKERKVFDYEGIEVHYIDATGKFKDNGASMPTYKKVLKNISRSIWYNIEVKRLIKKNKIDIVQSTSTYSLALFRSKKVPYLIRFSSYEPLVAGAVKEDYSIEKYVKCKRLDHKISARAWQKADVLMAPSFFIKQIVEKQTEKKVHIVESPVNSKCIVKQNEDLLQKYGLSSDRYWITYCRLSLGKSIHILAEIIDKLLSDFPNMKYVIVGTDRYITYKGKRILASELFFLKINVNRERFIFINGIYDKEKLFYLIQRSYICVLPTRTDNLSNSILEAMDLGKIVISSDKTSAEQLITDGYNGYLTQIDNAEELYQKVKEAMQLTRNEKEKMEQRAYERVKDLTPENVCNKMLELYEQTIQIFKNRKSSKNNWRRGEKLCQNFKWSRKKTNY